MKKIIIMAVILAQTAYAKYDTLKRFTLLEDQIKTQEMMFPLKHDFILDFKVYLNTEALNFVSSLSDAAASKTQSSINSLVSTYGKSENFFGVNVNIGIPLPSFSISKASFSPDLRIGIRVSDLLGLPTETLTINDLLDLLPLAARSALSGIVSNCIGVPTADQDLVDFLLNQCGATNPEKALISSLMPTGKFFWPGSNAPIIKTYFKAEVKVGPSFDFKVGDNVFGNFGIYALARADVDFTCATKTILAGGNCGELNTSNLNTTMNLVTDLKGGYKLDQLSVFASVEELKLSRISDNESKAGKLVYGEDPLIRVHGEYVFDLNFVKLTPFAGFSKRAAYDLGDGAYAGAEGKMFLMDEALMFRARATFDKSYVTLAPMFKFWVMNIDTMFKIPLKSEVDGVKPPTVMGVNLRFAI